MEKAEFEQKFLALINQTDVQITAANVAYHIGIPIEEANDHLIALELGGVLTQEFDSEGNASWVMPNRPMPGTLPARVGEQAVVKVGDESTPNPGIRNPAELPPAPLYSGPQTAPAKGRNVNGLVLNTIFPGVGSIICGRSAGFGMLGVALLGIVLTIALPGWSRLLGLLMLAGDWIWSVSAGIKLLDDREPRPGSAR